MAGCSLPHHRINADREAYCIVEQKSNDPRWDQSGFNIELDPRSRYYFAVVLERQGDKDGAADSYWFVVQQLGPDAGFGILAARALQQLGYVP